MVFLCLCKWNDKHEIIVKFPQTRKILLNKIYYLYQRDVVRQLSKNVLTLCLREQVIDFPAEELYFLIPNFKHHTGATFLWKKHKYD